MSQELRVIYFDDVARHLEAYGDLWKELLTSVVTDIDLIRVATLNKEIISTKLPHIVIVDNVVRSEDGTESDNEGASFIAEMKELFPHILFILFTEQTFSVRTLAQLYPNPDLIVPKPNFRSKVYQNGWIIPRISKILARRPVGTVRIQDARVRAEFKDTTKHIECIIEQALNDIISYESGSIDDIRLKKLTGGASGASVFLAEVTGVQRLRNVPIVFRFSNSEDIQSELTNYKRFVALQVPHNLKVELLGAGFNEAYGGAIYAFALGDIQNTQTAGSLLKSMNADEVNLFSEICVDLFESRNIGWYMLDDTKKEEVVEYFSNSTEYSPAKDSRRIRGFQKNIKEFNINNFSINGDNITCSNSKFHLPRNIIDKFDKLFLNQCICHGDFNLNNLIISNDSKRLALIDFEYSGFDHLFKDFVSLEVSLLAYVELGEEVGDIYKKQKFNLENLNFNDNNSDPLQIVRGKIAKKYEVSDIPHINKLYLICLAFHIFKVAALPVIDEKHFKNMLGTLCAIMHILATDDK